MQEVPVQSQSDINGVDWLLAEDVLNPVIVAAACLEVSPIPRMFPSVTDQEIVEIRLSWQGLLGLLWQFLALKESIDLLLH